MTFRRLILVSHRWLGLTTALFLFIVSLTGAIIVWQIPSFVRRVAGPLHQSLMLGRPGHAFVVLITGLSVVITVGGLILWWKQKRIAIRTDSGWRRIISDVHHSLGVIGFAFMLLLAATGIVMSMTTPADGAIRRLAVDLHTGRPYWRPIRVLYSIGSLSFAVQIVSGLVMWWKPGGSNWPGGVGRVRK